MGAISSAPDDGIASVAAPARAPLRTERREKPVMRLPSPPGAAGVKLIERERPGAERDGGAGAEPGDGDAGPLARLAQERFEAVRVVEIEGARLETWHFRPAATQP